MNYTIIHASLLNGHRDMKVRENMTVWIRDGIISSIVENGEVMADSEVIDLKGMYLMPGLINMHVHLAASGKPPKSEKKVDYKSLADKLLKSKLVKQVYLHLESGYAKQELYSGVTTMRTLGGLKDFDGIIRDRINAGKIEGPRILSANTALSVPGGHFAGSLATETKSAEEAVKDIQRIAASNPDVIKLMVTGGVMDADKEGEPGALRMPPEIVKAACEEAHRLGYKVAAHVESPEGVRVALENGVDTIEHGALPDEEIIRLFKERKAAHIITLSPALPYALFDPSVSHAGEIGVKNGKVVFEGIVACGKKCLEEGIPVGMGTDTGCPFITHYNMWREAAYFRKYMEVSAEYALYTATLGNAEIAGIADITGSVDVGKSADLIVSEHNPLDDFANLKQLKYVFMQGRMVKDPHIKKMANVDTELDKSGL